MPVPSNPMVYGIYCTYESWLHCSIRVCVGRGSMPALVVFKCTFERYTCYILWYSRYRFQCQYLPDAQNWIHGTSLCFEEIAITFPVLHPNPRDLGVKIKVIYKKTSTRLHHQTVIVPTNCEIHGYASYVWDCLSIAIHRLVISLILVVDIKLHFKTNIKNRTNDEQNTSIFCLYLFIWAACQ